MTVDARTRKRALAAIREGRVRVEYADAHYTRSIFAKVKGYAGVYTVRRNPDGTWTCDCAEWLPATDCSHVHAVRLITDLAVG